MSSRPGSGCAKAASTSGRASDAAAGWGGDRLAVMNGPDGAWAVAWKTAWDTAADAAAFEKAATTALGKAGGVGKVLPGEGGKTRWVVVAQRRDDAQQVAGVLGLGRARPRARVLHRVGRGDPEQTEGVARA